MVCYSKLSHSQASFDQHMKSAKHKRREAYLAERRSGTPASVPLSVASRQQSEVEDKNAVEKPDEVKFVPLQDSLERTEGEEEEAGEGEEHDPPIPLGTCLFCSQVFEELDECLDHMLKIHGFFIPCKKSLITCRRSIDRKSLAHFCGLVQIRTTWWTWRACWNLLGRRSESGTFVYIVMGEAALHTLL